jgi:DNA-binding transcriptional MerR regulator
VGDLARLAGVAIPTVKRYVRHGLLAPVRFYGRATRYPHDYLVRILALRFYRATGTKTLAELRRRLDSVTFAEMETWVMAHPLPAETLAALRAGSDSLQAQSASSMPHDASALVMAHALNEKSASPSLNASGWQRFQLMPGLELQLEPNAEPAARHLADLCRAVAALAAARA